MNIYQKLQAMRVDLQNMNIKKSGENRFAGYKYYELGDIMPPINQLQQKYGTCSYISYGEETARLTIVNAEKPDELLVFESPMKDAVLKGAHPIQNLGAVETYQRRYLYMTAFEIVEADVLDATQGSEKSPQSNSHQKPTNNTANNQKAAQGAKNASQTQSKPKASLPDEIGAAVNAKIKEAKDSTGKRISEIVADVEEKTGIKIKDMTEEQAPAVFEALDDIIGELPF